MLLGVIPPMPGAPAFAAPGLQGPVRGIGGPGFNQMAPLGRGLPPGMRMFIGNDFSAHLSLSVSFRSTRDVSLQRSAVFYYILCCFSSFMWFCSLIMDFVNQIKIGKITLG